MRRDLSALYEPIRRPIMKVASYVRYQTVISQLKRQGTTRSERPKRVESYSEGSLETFMSLGLGSAPDGRTISQVTCGNSSSGGRHGHVCTNPGVLSCSRCMLVKYCSGHCQRQHWAKHRLVCEHAYMSDGWRPNCIYQAEREPNRYTISRPSARKPNSCVLESNCLQLQYNEGFDVDQDFKICYTSSDKIRGLIQTVNGLPKHYRGNCDILINSLDANAVNRNLVILYALLSSGPSIEESAELVTHLMYSAALPAASAAYIRSCIRVIYDDVNTGDGEMSFRTSLKTRGEGQIHSMQTTVAMRRPMEMFLSAFDLKQGLKNRRDVVLDPFHDRERETFLFNLKPAHRMALLRYWETGILAPFSLDVGHFTQPNRLMYDAGGNWLSLMGMNPLHGWDVFKVEKSGLNHDIATSDIMGCLYFHVKQELMEFAKRMKEFRVNVYLTQFHPQVLAKGISIGVLPAFHDACFDRIETSNLIDCIGMGQCLKNWAPLLNRQNECASILMHSRNWHRTQLDATAQFNPRTRDMLVKRCEALSIFDPKLQKLSEQWAKSHAISRLIESLDAFVDHDNALQAYLREQDAEDIADDLGLRMRGINRVCPKRCGISIEMPEQRIPNLSKDGFYNLFTIGGADFLARFLEFEVASLSPRSVSDSEPDVYEASQV